MSVLILDSHSESAIPLIQELGKIGVVVHVAAKENCLAFKSVFSSKCFIYPEMSDSASFIDWVKSIDDEEGYELIVPTTEKMLYQFQRCEENDRIRVKSVLASKISIETALNKEASTGLAMSLDIPVPRSQLVVGSDPSGPPRHYPIVLKTLYSQISNGENLVYASVKIARNENQYNDFVERWGSHTAIQQQDYFPGRGWGIEMLYEHGDRKWYFAHERIHELPLTGGASSYRRSVIAPAKMLKAATALLDELKWHGIAMIEFKVNELGEFVFLEINPRPWGSLALSVKSGVNFPIGLYQLAKNLELQEQKPYKINYYARNIIKDIVWFKENFNADHTDDLLLTRGRLTSLLEGFRLFTGNESWDHFDWRDLSLSRAQLFQLVESITQKISTRVKGFFQSQLIRYRHNRNLKLISIVKDRINNVLFVCYGNICRSPVAEYAAKNLNNRINFSSAGFHKEELRKSPKKIIQMAGLLDIDIQKHRSKCLTVQQMEQADVVFVMDKDNYDFVTKNYPSFADKVLMLGLFSQAPALFIPDPFSLNEKQAKASLDKVVAGVKGFVKWLA